MGVGGGMREWTACRIHGRALRRGTLRSRPLLSGRPTSAFGAPPPPHFPHPPPAHIYSLLLQHDQRLSLSSGWWHLHRACVFVCQGGWCLSSSSPMSVPGISSLAGLSVVVFLVTNCSWHVTRRLRQGASYVVFVFFSFLQNFLISLEC